MNIYLCCHERYILIDMIMPKLKALWFRFVSNFAWNNIFLTISSRFLYLSCTFFMVFFHWTLLMWTRGDVMYFLSNKHRPSLSTCDLWWTGWIRHCKEEKEEKEATTDKNPEAETVSPNKQESRFIGRFKNNNKVKMTSPVIDIIRHSTCGIRAYMI